MATGEIGAVKILIGVARGLAFLHSLNSQVIYRDFKTSNILLEEVSKTSEHNIVKTREFVDDYCCAKQCMKKLIMFLLFVHHSYTMPSSPIECSHVTTRIMGTYGYAAPEYVATGHLYVKSDVYSFGVVLLEMLTRLRAVDQNRPREQSHLVDWIKPYLLKTNKLKKVIDSRLKGR
ncbi:hypothetical protein CASFOL_019441 [Castilleja foliolosa]|uniref:Protein kinase domain-containing protein n=1 Tax=Castilleja foliolosa TaxID=1961234 RepID=A0ABD3D8R3_9LAMI